MEGDAVRSRFGVEVGLVVLFGDQEIWPFALVYGGYWPLYPACVSAVPSTRSKLAIPKHLLTVLFASKDVHSGRFRSRRIPSSLD